MSTGTKIVNILLKVLILLLANRLYIKLVVITILLSLLAYISIIVDFFQNHFIIYYSLNSHLH